LQDTKDDEQKHELIRYVISSKKMLVKKIKNKDVNSV
jgi:hypothetical protein